MKIMSLADELVGNGPQLLGLVVGGFDPLLRLGGLCLSLEVDPLSGSLGLLGLGVVILDPVEKLVTARGVFDVLDADVDALLHLALAVDLVDDDANGAGGNVVDDTRLSVVRLVGHTALDGTVCLDVDNVAHVVLLHVRSEGDDTLLPEGPGEHVACPASLTVGAAHI